MINALKTLAVEENTTSRLQIRLFDVVAGCVLLVLGFVGIVGGMFALRSGEVLGGLLSLVIGVGMFGGMAYFLGVKRVILDREADAIIITFRALARHWRKDFKLSDMRRIVLAETKSHRRELGLGDPPGKKNYFHVEIDFGDVAPYCLSHGSGRHVYEVGQALMAWHQELTPQTA